MTCYITLYYRSNIILYDIVYVYSYRAVWPFGGVMYHRFLTKTPSQQQVLQERARQRQKLRERNQRLAPWDFEGIRGVEDVWEGFHRYIIYIYGTTPPRDLPFQ